MSIGQFRPPAVPLVVHDPYFSVWSFTDKLNESWTRHWTGGNGGLCGLLRVDGAAYRFCGDLRQVEAAEQLSVEVLPTRTIYQFAAGPARLTLSFITPCLPHKLDVLARPATYIEFAAESSDGRPHEVELYFDCGCDLAVNEPSQSVTWGRLKLAGMEVLRSANAEQRPLSRAGDNLRIDWGSVNLCVPDGAGALGPSAPLREFFVAHGSLPDDDSLDTPCRVDRTWPCLAAAFKLGAVGSTPVERMVILAYDDVWSVEYLDQRLRGYWRRGGLDFAGMLAAARAEFPALKEDCRRFDAELLADCRASGGEKFAQVCALAFRQALGAHKLVASADGVPFFLSKENFSNGCIATVDVTYPSAPLFLLLQPDLLKGMMIPIMDYALKPRWKFPFAPHDLGTYPLANGQVYGGCERDERDQMPVEECGNLLLLAGALLKLCGDLPFVRQYWPLLTRWAEYLRDKGYDPERQLCTDDFAGHLAHNANLSLKAILALGAYSRMAAAMGEPDKAASYLHLAQNHVASWLKDAAAGDHYRLAFDQPGSWSQKYNLVWDKLLGLDLFPPEVAATETAYYRKNQGKYGIALDNRKAYTKLDWIFWSATLSGEDEDFRALTDPVHAWLYDTPSRVPMSDWYDTVDGKMTGFQARSVVGGVFLKLLYDAKLRGKWVARASQPGEVAP